MPSAIRFESVIDIDAPRDLTFDFVSDLSNDPLWRSEVDRMEVRGAIEVGTVAVEYSTLFMGLMKTVTPTVIATLERPHLCVFETPANAEPRLVSRRQLRSRGENRTEFVYRLETELRWGGVAGAMGAKLLEALYRPRLPRYLNTLKTLVEAEAAARG